jgi:hypothetical protein
VSREGHCHTRGSSTVSWTAAIRLLLRQHCLWQPIAACIGGEQIVDIYDRRLSCRRVNGNFEEVEQVARARRASGSLGADHSGVIRGTVNHALNKAGPIVGSLREVNVPRCGVRVAAAGGAVIDDIDGAIVGCDPRENGSGSRRGVHDDDKRPGCAVVRRGGKERIRAVRPARVNRVGDRISRDYGKNIPLVVPAGPE